VKIGIHLPQFGPLTKWADAIPRAARHAEALGFHGVWVSDHIVHPAAQGYPSPYLYDPLVSLTWAAAVTSAVELGTSVLVVPTHNPLELGNSLASLDALSGGRIVAGVGVGWSEAEYDALGADFAHRGRRLDEALHLWRAIWTEDPVSFAGEFTSFEDMRVVPKPARRIPLWVGGMGPRARRRAIELGDGYHLIGVTPDEARAPIAEVRAQRPEEGFTISLRTGWDPQGMEHDRIRRELDEYGDAGISDVICAPWRKDLDDWLRSMDQLAALTELVAR